MRTEEQGRISRTSLASILISENRKRDVSSLSIGSYERPHMVEILESENSSH